MIGKIEADDIQKTLQYALEVFEQTCQCGNCEPCTDGQKALRRSIALLDKYRNQGE